MKLRSLLNKIKIQRLVRSIVDSAYGAFFLLADQLTYVSPKVKDRSSKKKILFIKLDMIGDFILWLDSAREIERMFPRGKFEITLLGNDAWVSLAERLPYFDEFWPVDRRRFIRNPLYRFVILKKVRKAGFQTVIQPTFSRESMFGDAIVRLSGAEEKIGSQGDCAITRSWVKRITDCWYTRLIPAVDKPLMELIRNAEFIRGLGSKEFLADAPSLLTESAKPKGFLGDAYYVIFPGAGSKSRQWPVSRFEEIAQRMYRATGWQGIVCGGNNDVGLGRTLERHSEPFLHNWCGKTSLKELVAIIGGAQILIGNETSAVHIAAAVSTPAACVLGGGHYGRFLPYELEKLSDKPLPVGICHKMRCFKCNWHCMYDVEPGDAAPCIEAVSVDDVWQTVQMILGNNTRNEI